jgi:pyruvate kinase
METRRQVAVLQDLCGPRIRLGNVPGDLLNCDHDAEFILSNDPSDSDAASHLTSTYRSLPDDLEVDQTVLFAHKTVATSVAARCRAGHNLK